MNTTDIFLLICIIAGIMFLVVSIRDLNKETNRLGISMINDLEDVNRALLIKLNSKRIK